MSLCRAIYHITLRIARGTLLPPIHLLGLPSLSTCLRAASTPLFTLLLLHGKSVYHLWMMPIPVSLSLYMASDYGVSPTTHPPFTLTTATAVALLVYARLQGLDALSTCCAPGGARGGLISGLPWSSSSGVWLQLWELCLKATWKSPGFLLAEKEAPRTGREQGVW